MNDRLSGPAQKSGSRRRRAVPLWRNRWVLSGAVAGGVAALASLGAWAWIGGVPQRAFDEARAWTVEASAAVGFRVGDVIVVGRSETAQADLLATLRLKRGTPLFGFDSEAARKRVERLPWVRAASIERVLPDTVVVTVEERVPLAVWQHKGQLALIDREGRVIMRDGLDRFSHLLLVVGEGAPTHAAELLQMLESQPALLTMVKAAVRVGGRRWNVRFDNGTDVRLPEDDPHGAWSRLADYERAHRILSQDVEVLDLRLPDRLIVRKTTAAAPPPPPPPPATAQKPAPRDKQTGTRSGKDT